MTDKKTYLEKDAGLAEHVREHYKDITPEKVALDLRKYDGPSEDNFILSSLVPILNELLKTSITTADIRADRVRYRNLYTFASLVEFWLLSHVFPSTDGSLEAQASRVERGTWMDNMIASTAARADVFLTNDSSLLKRCNLFRERAIVSFKSMNLSGFISA